MPQGQVFDVASKYMYLTLLKSLSWKANTIMHTFCHTKTHFNETSTSMVADAVKFVKILKRVSVIGRCIIPFCFCCKSLLPFPIAAF